MIANWKEGLNSALNHHPGEFTPHETKSELRDNQMSLLASKRRHSQNSTAF